MDFKKARDLLELPNNFSLRQLKKNYHTKALKIHPDKCTDNPLANEKFNEINEAYSYLLTYLSISSENMEQNSNANLDANLHTNLDANLNVNNKKPMSYKELLCNFLNINNTELRDIISTIVSGYKKTSVSMFENLEKQTAMDLYSFIVKYQDLLYLDSEDLVEIKSIIREKMKNDDIYVLNPSLSDIFNHRIYKLTVNSNTYYVPLWLSELHFTDESSDSDIIVLCVPELPEHISIDENNNVHYNIKTSVSGLLKNEKISIDICDLDDSEDKKKVEILASEMFIKKHQTVIKRGEGIAVYHSNDYYNVDKLSTIFVHVTLI